MDTILSQKALEEQDSKANALAERRCQCRTGDSKIQAKNKDRIIFRIPPVVIPIME